MRCGVSARGRHGLGFRTTTTTPLGDGSGSRGGKKGLCCRRGCVVEKSSRDVRRFSLFDQAEEEGEKGGGSFISFPGKVIDFITEQFDYESWAPRSARAWRLGTRPEVQTKQSSDEVDELIASLQQQVSEKYRHEDQDFLNGALDGEQLKEMMLKKYGVLYDMNFKCVSLPLKRVLSLNIMWSYYGQKSFPMSEEQYELKLEGIAQLVRQLNKEGVVRDFFAKEPKAERGLPARPNVGTAVIIRFTDLDDSVINEYF